MSKVHTLGKVKNYDPETGKLVCTYLPPIFTWKEGRVRTSGNHESRCNIDTREFDVTISPETANKLVPDYKFNLVYDNGGTEPVKVVTEFADQHLSSVATAAE